ncbi:PfkB domain-containing protein [Aphelenchoides besseyi]|nr:PfkB domain-containing protein [Aphelenchoides besseyi]KAI6195279.1 PfkB domain-containing protein [Aphelenchoides besseyi]
MGKILLNGVTCVDIVNYVERFPEEDSDNRGVDQLITLGGNATNSATVLQQLNDYTEVFMALPTGNTLFDSLIVKSGVNVSRCVHRNSDNVPVSTVIVSLAKGSRTILHHESDLQEPKASEFIAEFSHFLGFGWVHFEAKAGREFDEVILMLEHVWNQRKQNDLPLKLSVELEIRVPSEWARWKNAEKTVDQIQRLFHAENKLVICPWAEKGVTARESVKSKFVHVPAFTPSSVVDTLGAGDTFIAAALHGLNSQRPLTEVLRFACMLAGRKCGQRGLMDLDLNGLDF